MGLIDSHCHLEMLEDPAAALADARAAGLEAVVTIGIDGPTSAGAVRMAERFDDVYATVALHPHDAHTMTAELLEALERLGRHERVVAVGECGLDFFRDLSPRDDQRRAFSAQMALARSLGKPLVVHVRDAAEEALAQLADEAAGLTVVLHCFSLAAHVDTCIERGYYASFAGNLTYKNAEDLRRAAACYPTELLLVETDAPFLSPVPDRGKPNRPAWVTRTAALLAELKGWTPEEAAAVTTLNTRRVFRLPGTG